MGFILSGTHRLVSPASLGAFPQVDSHSWTESAQDEGFSYRSFSFSDCHQTTLYHEKSSIYTLTHRGHKALPRADILIKENYHWKLYSRLASFPLTHTLKQLLSIWSRGRISARKDFHANNCNKQPYRDITVKSFTSAFPTSPFTVSGVLC